jgi:hypothetical protein
LGSIAKNKSCTKDPPFVRKNQVHSPPTLLPDLTKIKQGVDLKAIDILKITNLHLLSLISIKLNKAEAN